MRFAAKCAPERCGTTPGLRKAIETDESTIEATVYVSFSMPLSRLGDVVEINKVLYTEWT